MILPANTYGYGLDYDFYSVNTALKTANVNASSGSPVLGARDQVFLLEKAALRPGSATFPLQNHRQVT